MVFSRSDVKKRNKEAHDPLMENPKRTKVHAQRKFAQGSGMNSPVKEMNLIKEREKAKHDDDPSDELPTNQPPTEDFLSFLCFRRTKYLNPRLNVFSEVPKQKKNSSSSKHTAHLSGTQKHKVGTTSQDYKKRLSAGRSGLQKGNAVRARTASNERQAIRKKAIDRQIRRKAVKRSAKPIRKTHPAILKRLGATRLRAGLRSGGQLPAGSDTGLNSDRRPKRGRPRRRRPSLRKNKMNVMHKKAKDDYEEENNEMSDEEEDDEEEEVVEEDEEEEEEEEDDEEEEDEEEKVDLGKKAKPKAAPKKGLLGMRTRRASNSPAQSPKKSSLTSRPTRKTKEAATLYMEMLTKDLRNPDEEFDDDYVRNFPELPSAMKKRDQNEDSKNESPKRGRQSKRTSSLTKEGNLKVRKLSKEAPKKSVGSRGSSPKRNQRACVKKIIPKGKTVMKFKGRLLRKRSLLKTRNAPQIKKSLRTRSNNRRAGKNFSEKTYAEDDESMDEEEDEEDPEDEIIEEVKKVKNNKKVTSQAVQAKSRVTRKNDQKKDTELIVTKSNQPNQKKRKSAPESSSASESEEESEDKDKPKPRNKSNDSKKMLRVSDRRKTLKMANESFTKASTSKRISLRNREENTSDHYEKLTPQTKNPRRSKRNKDSDYENDEGDDGQTKKGARRSKYTEDSDDDFEDDYDSSKTRSSLRQKGSNIKGEVTEPIKKHSAKGDDSSKLKVSKTGIKKEETIEKESNPKRGKGRPLKNLRDKETSDVEESPRRRQNSIVKKSMYESEEEEEEESIPKKTRGSIQRKNPKSFDELNKKQEIEEDNIELKKTREVQLRKASMNIESDEDSITTNRRSRGAQPKKGKISETIVTKTEESINNIAIVEKSEGKDDKIEKSKAPIKRQKKIALEKVETVIPKSLEIVEKDDQKSEKLTPVLNKVKKVSEDLPSDIGSLEIKSKVDLEVISQQIKEIPNKKVKPIDEVNNSGESINMISIGTKKGVTDSVEGKSSNDEREENSSQPKTRTKSSRKGKPVKKIIIDSEHEDFLDDVSKGGGNKKVRKPFENLIVKIDNHEGRNTLQGPVVPIVSSLALSTKEIKKERNNLTEVSQAGNVKEIQNTVKKEVLTDDKDRANTNHTSIDNKSVSMKDKVIPSGSQPTVELAKEKTVVSGIKIKNEIEFRNDSSPSVENGQKVSRKVVALATDICVKTENDLLKNTKSKRTVEIKDSATIHSLQNKVIKSNIANHVDVQESHSRKIRKSVDDSNPKDMMKSPQNDEIKIFQKVIKPSLKQGNAEERKCLNTSVPPGIESKGKPASISLKKDMICDKVNKNSFNNRIEGAQHNDSLPESKQNIDKTEVDKLNFKKGIDALSKKPKKSTTENSGTNEIRAKMSNAMNSSGIRDSSLASKVVDFKKSKDTKVMAADSFKDNAMAKRQTRLSVGSPERDEKRTKKQDFKEKILDDIRNSAFKEIIEPKPAKPGRKPALTARAQFVRNREEDEDLPRSKPHDLIKTAAPIKRKSLSERGSIESLDSSGSSFDCKVFGTDIGERSGGLLKSKKMKKHSERNLEKPKVSNFNNTSNDLSSKGNSSSLTNNSTISLCSLDLEKSDEGREKPINKPSIGDTWRQAFKNAKIPKPGHLSPVPNTTKPFVRQKITNLSSKSKDQSDSKGSEASKPKSSQSLSPFKVMLAKQRSLSPDIKKNLQSPFKVNFTGFETPVKKSEEVKAEIKKQETPKTLTQLQYEKRSSKFINSYLDPGPTAVLPAFESIRAYKKEMKKEEPKEIPKSEIPVPTVAIPETVAKPSPEGKHLNLPLAVEHTLRKNSPITVSKKPPMKPISYPQEKKTDNVPIPKPVVPCALVEKNPPLAAHPVPFPPEVPTNSASPSNQPATRDNLVREPSDLSSLAKKKVNMTNEEINRWLNDSTSSGIEHKKDCGIFENNQCECSYRTSESSMQNSIGVRDLVPKDDKIDHGVVQPAVPLKELDEDGKYVAETISTCKVEDYKEKLLSKTSTPDNKMAPPRTRRSSGQDRFKSTKSMTEDEMCEYDFRFDRTSNSPRESVSDVSSVTHRDDASSSSEVPERKIFHQKRTTSGSKRPSISSPTAFSAENESSIYAFKPDPPSSANRPFRRGRGKSGEQESDGKQPPSSSIAVQVNLFNEAEGLECSTQTERPSDDNEGQIFYIPLPDEQIQGGLPHGVAVKLDTEGPDQRVIMRAKLVTKSSNSSFSTASRTFLSPGRNTHQKPEQKVRPLVSGRAPIGTVQPTVREPQKVNDHGTGNHEKNRSSWQESQSSKGTQISQASPKGQDSPRACRNSTKVQKQLLAEGKAPAETAPPVTTPTAIEWKGTEFPSPDIPPTLLEAPTFYPSEKEFQDPLEYIETLTPLAQSFGICRIVPPSSFKPECKVSDDMRFTAYNQYVHKLMERWGPNVKELCAIKKYLTTQSISLIQLPLIGSMEVDLPRLYQTVQAQGGLKEVIEKKRWAKVADAMRIPKSAQDRLTKLDDIYCKYLLPYDTLSHEERTKLLEEIEEEWKEREKRLVAEDDSGNNASGEGSDESCDADDNVFECISKGKNMPLSAFFRIARNTMYMWFKENTPSPEEVESEFWRHVSTRTYHVCVHCGSIDSGPWGYGFPTTKTSATSRHPWNLKVLTNSSGSILRSLGPLMGVTVPTLHVGMLFSSCCWYRDPHALPWIEYLHTGASKIWYGVPGSRASELRSAMYPLLPRHTRDKPIWLPSDTMMVPPQYLLDGGVSVCRVVQEPGQFVLVFPKAFTSTISTGYIVSESVYFAQPTWLNSALQVFKDIQDSCEPPVFSLHKLLFSIANDTRSTADILNQILPMLTSVIESEVDSRKKLEKLGLTSWERLPSTKSGRRKKQEEEQSDLECDTCRGALFLSMVTNSNEDCSYCIDHAIEALSKDQELLKYCKLLITYDEDEMEDLIDKVNARIEAKSQKKQKEKGASTSGVKN